MISRSRSRYGRAHDVVEEVGGIVEVVRVDRQRAARERLRRPPGLAVHVVLADQRLLAHRAASVGCGTS